MTGIFTPGYAAVEQFTDGRQGPFTDIYALSATLYQSIAGEKPPSAIDRVLEDKCVPLAKRRPAGFAPALLAGIDRGMAVRPEARPQSIAAWRTVLFPGETRPKPTAAPATTPPAEKSTRWRTAAIAGLATVLVAGAAGGAAVMFWPQKAPVTDAERQQAERSAAAATATAAEKQRAEEEAKRLAAAEQARRQQADAEARQQAEVTARQQAAAEDARRQQADADARQQAAAEQARRLQADTDARRQAEAAARQQAAAEEAQRRADADARVTAAAEETRRQAAEQEAREKEAREKAIADDSARSAAAEAEKAKAVEVVPDRKAAEVAEDALHLGSVDRQKVQVALTAQGFDTRGTDGMLGPRSREMVAAWQAAHSLPATGFLDAAQRQRLIAGSAAAIAKFGADQKKAAEEEAKRREQARPDGTTAAAAASRRAPDTSPSAFAGRWTLARSKCIPTTPQRFFGVTVEGNRFTYGFTFANRSASCSVSIQPNGSFANGACEAPMSGQISGNRMTVSQRHPEIICDFEFQKQ
jgi:peptidoglycan hydrolase-like protein with peptidoglycan-binding domain